MKYLIQLLFLVACISGYAQSETPEQVLTNIEDSRLKAIVNRDSVTLKALYDDRYTGILTSGRPVDKAGVIKFQLSGSLMVKISIEEVKANVYGDVGITTGKQVNRSKSGDVLGQSKFIRVYLKKGNTWKIIHSQGTLISSEQM